MEMIDASSVVIALAEVNEEDELKNILHYNWRSIFNKKQYLEVRKQNLGTTNSTYKITYNSSNYICKLMEVHETIEEDVNFEQDYLRALKEKVPFQIPSCIPPYSEENFVISKLTSQKSKEFLIILYNFIEGYQKDESSVLSTLELKEIGKTIAQLHQGILQICSGIKADCLPNTETELINDAGFTEPFNKKNILSELWKSTNELEEKKKQGIDLDDVQSTFLQYSKRLCETLESLPTREYLRNLQYPIHRDIRLSNIIWKDGKIVGIIDFENVSNMNDVLYKDVAIAVQGCCRESEYSYQSDSQKIRYLVDSYTMNMKIEESNLRLIFDLITAGCIEDFSYLYWLYENDRRKFDSFNEGKIKGGFAGMKLYAESAIDHNDKRLMYFGHYNDNY